jgi:hypothetical protein
MNKKLIIAAAVIGVGYLLYKRGKKVIAQTKGTGYNANANLMPQPKSFLVQPSGTF